MSIKDITPKGWLIIAIVIVLIILLILWIKNSGNKTSQNTTNIIKGQNVNYIQPIFPLTFGSRGEEVKKVQHYLNVKYGEKLVEDGIWGNLTQAAIVKDLGVSGITLEYYNANIK